MTLIINKNLDFLNMCSYQGKETDGLGHDHCPKCKMCLNRDQQGPEWLHGHNPWGDCCWETCLGCGGLQEEKFLNFKYSQCAENHKQYCTDKGKQLTTEAMPKPDPTCDHDDGNCWELAPEKNGMVVSWKDGFSKDGLCTECKKDCNGKDMVWCEECASCLCFTCAHWNAPLRKPIKDDD